MKKKRKINIKVILVGVVVIALVIGIVLFRKNNTLAGADYIAKQGKLSTEDVSQVLVSKKRDEQQAAVNEGRLDVFFLLNDYVIYGDSRVMGFYIFDFLDQSRCFADSGNTLLDVDMWNESLASMMPSNVIISYGINDLGLDLNSEVEGGYEQLAKDKMNTILSIVPKAKIYLCGIIPVAPYALPEQPLWGNYEMYNEMLQSACSAVEQCTYVDDEVLADGGNAPIYSEAGVHYTRSFYPVWTQYILSKMD